MNKILILGSGALKIGQAGEFDYSGSQAARSLREEGIEVSLINSNPATIMTDKMNADHVYLWPLTAESVEKILQERQIDAVLPTMGGQTALNLAKECDELGIWEKYKVFLFLPFRIDRYLLFKSKWLLGKNKLCCFRSYVEHQRLIVW
ncbi:MAG: hypothetical protein ACEQR5_09430 [Moraxellaceae bacterium]